MVRGFGGAGVCFFDLDFFLLVMILIGLSSAFLFDLGIWIVGSVLVWRRLSPDSPVVAVATTSLLADTFLDKPSLLLVLRLDTILFLRPVSFLSWLFSVIFVSLVLTSESWKDIATG